MQRRTFLRTVSVTAAGSVLGQYGTRRASAQSTISDLAFDSTSSLLDADQEPLTDESSVAVWAAETAYNVDSDGDGDSVSYDDQSIPLVAVDGDVVGFGAMVAPDDADFRFGNEEFLLNVWDAHLGGSGTVLWDESHGQFYTLDGSNAGGSPGFTSFESYAEDAGYTVDATDDLASDLSDADGVVITSPSDSFTDSETEALAEFVSDGGAVFLHDQSDYSGFDETDNLNDLAAALELAFRFNDDQVEDETSNAGSVFVPTTDRFVEDFDYFEDREGLGLDLDPDESYEVEVVGRADGDTVDVRFVNESGAPENPIRILGVDAPESASNANAERPEEWEGLADEAEPGDDGDGDESSVRPVGDLNFFSSSSLVDASGGALTDDSVVAVRAEDTAYNEDADGDGDAYVYEDEPIPLAAIDESVGVVAFGANLVSDGASLDGGGNEDEFVLNVWDEHLGGSGTVHWDEGHDQFDDYRLDNFSTFEAAAEDAGYTVEATESVPSDTEEVDGFVVVTPEEGAPFTDDEKSALTEFVSDGGTVFLHARSDFSDYDGTGTMNGVLETLGADFRFNDDQVYDEGHNEGADYDILTSDLDTDSFPYLDGSDSEDGNSDDGGDSDDGDSDDSDGDSDDPYGGVDLGEYGDAEYPYLAAWADEATAFAESELPDGTRATLSFDSESAVYDEFGRVLGYLRYDADGDGDRDALYNEELLRQGYARVYGSSYSRHDEFWAAEAEAREEGTGLWAASNPDESPPIRDGPVEEVFAPDPASVVTESGTVDADRVHAFASSTAEREDADTTYDGDVPLGAVDRGANLAYLGAPLISEQYEAAEDYPVSTAGYDNFAFVTALADALGDRSEGPVLIDGGHDQFNLGFSLSSEDAAYYQRYLEGQDAAFEQVNDLDSGRADDRLDEARALIVTTPRYGFSDAELDAVESFADDGGAVVLMGSGAAPAPMRAHLDGVADGVGSDLRLGTGRVRDDGSNLNDDPAVVTTTNVTVPDTDDDDDDDEDDDDDDDDGDDSLLAEIDPSTTDATVGERVTFGVEDVSGDDRWIESLEWTFGDGESATGWWAAHSYDDAGTYTVELTATDNEGDETTDAVDVEVAELDDPLATIDPSTTDADVDERITFEVEDETGDDRWIESLEWTFGDGETATGWWAAHSYDDAGTYTVELTATDNTDHSTTDDVEIDVS